MSDRVESTITKIYAGSNDRTVKENLLESLTFIQRGYYLWTVLYWTLGILTLTLPALAAMDIYWGSSVNGNRYLSGFGALAGAIFGFLKVSENANNYDASTQLAWKAQQWFAIGRINNAEAADMIGQAFDIMKGSYSTVSTKSPATP